MDFLGSRGSRTFFPATNAGVEAFLKEKGYASVEDIPASFCDTLLRACIIERIMYTYDLPETQQENNELDLPVILESKGDTLDANQMALTIVNRRATVSWYPIPAWGLRCWTSTTRISRFIMRPSGGQD